MLFFVVVVVIFNRRLLRLEVERQGYEFVLFFNNNFVPLFSHSGGNGGRDILKIGRDSVKEELLVKNSLTYSCPYNPLRLGGTQGCDGYFEFGPVLCNMLALAPS